MIPFIAKVYDVLAASALPPLLASVAGTSIPAIYVNHLSQFESVAYPAVSLFWDMGGADPDVAIADQGILDVDIWTEEKETPPDPRAYGLSGAWQVYTIIKPLLHKAERGQRLSNPAAYRLAYCREIPGSVHWDFDRQLKLYHLQTRFSVVLMLAGAETAYAV